MVEVVSRVRARARVWEEKVPACWCWHEWNMSCSMSFSLERPGWHLERSVGLGWERWSPQQYVRDSRKGILLCKLNRIVVNLVGWGW